MTAAIDRDALRRRQIGQLARALRQHLKWHAHLSADGAPRASAQQLADLATRAKAAQRRHDEAQRRALFADDEPAPKPQSTAKPEARSAPTQPEHNTPQPATNTAPPDARALLEEDTKAAAPAKSRKGLYKALPMVTTSAHSTPAPRPQSVANDDHPLETVRTKLGDCQRCRLAQSRKNLIFGQGNPDADLMFIGEVPGFYEDKEARPYAGRPGQLFDKMLRAMGYRRQEVYICTVLKCRTPGGRAPKDDELTTCKPFLIEQITAIKPKVIVAMGPWVTRTLLRDATPLERLRGQWQRRQGIHIMPTFDPGHLLRNGADKRLTWSDLQQVMTQLGDKTSS